VWRTGTSSSTIRTVSPWPVKRAGSSLAAAVAGSSGSAGSMMVKVVPRSGPLSTVMRPPCCCTMPYACDSPSPVPRPWRLGREERLEDPLTHVLRHAHARVADLDHQPLGRGRLAGLGARVLVAVRQAEAQLAAERHASRALTARFVSTWRS
jgi:hypothetical protein